MSTTTNLRAVLGDLVREMADRGMSPEQLCDEVRAAHPGVASAFLARLGRRPIPGSVEAGCPECGAAIHYSMGGTRGSAHCERSRSACVHGIPEPDGVGSGACNWRGTLIRGADSDTIMIEPTRRTT